MEEREPELPVATMRPRRVLGRLVALRGAFARWLRDRRRSIDGRSAPLILTAVVFCGMMLMMSHVADRAQRAGAAIDQMHRDAGAWPSARQHGGMLFRGSWTTTDPWSAATRYEPAEPDLDLEPARGAAAATTAVGRNAALFYIVAGGD